VKTYITVYFGAALVAMLLVPILSRLAKRYSLVDLPGLRKVHTVPIPRIGGVVFWVSTLALVLPVFFLSNTIGESFREAETKFIVLLVTSSFIFAVGLIDDLRSVRGYVKLLCLIAASLAICASGVGIRSVSIGSWELELGWLAWPLAVFWILTITVGVSLIDGLDGLAAGVAAIVCGSIVILAVWSDYGAMAVLMLALLGSLTGFLFFNCHPAKIFMGDSGSMFLGFMIGAGSLVCQAKTSALVGLTFPFLVLGVPILDAGFSMFRRRIIERRSMFAADRKHLHHRLLDLGLSQRTVVMIILAVTTISASIGVVMLTVDGGWSLALLAAGLVVLVSVFTCLNGSRHREILLALKRNWIISCEKKAERRSFENAQVRMHESRSLRAWWETIYLMCKQMHFQSIALWKRQEADYINTLEWNAPKGKFPTGKTVNLTLPLEKNGATEWELRARIWVNGYLELSGRQSMLLARLMDEFPPPKEQGEAEVSDQHAEAIQRYMIEEAAEFA